MMSWLVFPPCWFQTPPANTEQMEGKTEKPATNKSVLEHTIGAVKYLDIFGGVFRCCASILHI